MAEKFNVVGFSGIPINRVYFNDRMDACAFIFRLEAEDRRLNLFEQGSYKVVIVEDSDE